MNNVVANLDQSNHSHSELYFDTKWWFALCSHRSMWLGFKFDEWDCVFKV